MVGPGARLEPGWAIFLKTNDIDVARAQNDSISSYLDVIQLQLKERP